MLYFPHNKHVKGKANISFSLNFLKSCFVVWVFSPSLIVLGRFDEK